MLKATPEIQQILDDLRRNNLAPYNEDKPLYKYVNIRTAKLILENSTIKFSSPNELNANDFDRDRIIMDFTPDYLEDTKHRAFIEALKHSKGCTENEAELYLKTAHGRRDYAKYPIDRIKDKLIHFHKTDVPNQAGIFCVTTSNKNAHLWERYGTNDSKQKDAGVCIEYKFPSLISNEFMAFRVNYDPYNSTFNYLGPDGKINRVDIYKWAITKPHQYSGEDEIRLILSELNPGLLKIPKDVFTGVYYGKKTAQSDIEEIESIIKNVGYSFDKGIRISY
jgi:hypothetical protein